MPDNTTLVLRDSAGEAIDTITTSLPSEIASLRGRGYATDEEHEQLDTARKGHEKRVAAETTARQQEPEKSSTVGESSAGEQTTSTGDGEEDAAGRPAARGGKKSPNTGR